MNAKKEFKMNLLNAEEMKGLTGGDVGCLKAGDTIKCNPDLDDYKQCASYEVKCTVEITYPKGSIFECENSGYSITCTEGDVLIAGIGTSPTAVVAPLSVSASASMSVSTSAMW